MPESSHHGRELAQGAGHSGNQQLRGGHCGQHGKKGHKRRRDKAVEYIPPHIGNICQQAEGSYLLSSGKDRHVYTQLPGRPQLRNGHIVWISVPAQKDGTRTNLRKHATVSESNIGLDHAWNFSDTTQCRNGVSPRSGRNGIGKGCCVG
ncbi:MAG: hypothetical protein KDA43_13515 [Hyphomonas sp.]|nr:hypothetical protein [Hyphomonas sp.]